ncbi:MULTISPECIES: hypothetical protein [Trichocoleus]|uniref:Uncharacterized protein n=1 Tax=Trichocoleus desertorum GB2-A4 TaxID=2933944 RepID=A0ABV0JHB3_9CYAN|nr:hypothetical protein [Trichocoleus sp. FACHB-46]MBD1865210.1 hypothetical protein [Trichocoleus sp. FACHB-46]
MQYRGRATPLVWRVIRHGSSSVGFEVYQAMLKRATHLVPTGVSVCFLADRGFAMAVATLLFTVQGYQVSERVNVVGWMLTSNGATAI